MLGVAMTNASAADPHAVLNAAKAASGGAAWDEVVGLRSELEIGAGGMQGTAQQLEDLRRGRLVSRFTLGPLSGATGDDGTSAWEQDSSGQSHTIDAGDERLRALNDRYLRARGYWYPERWAATFEALGTRTEGERSFDVVRVIPEGTRAIELWFDGADHRLARTVEKAAVETITTSLGDYRDVGGVMLPFDVRISNGDTKYDQTIRASSITRETAVDDAAFRVPEPPPPDFRLAGDATSTTVPFELLGGHIHLHVMLDGHGPFTFVCDTGGQNILTPEVAKTLGVAVEGALQGRGVGEKSADVGFAKVKQLTLGAATLDNQVFAVFDLSELAGVGGTPFDGIVGYEVFKRFVVRVDYETSKLTLTLPSAYKPSGKGTVVPFTFDGTHPQVDGTIDGIPGRFTIDTGSRSSVDLLRPFAEKHQFAEKLGAKLEGITGWGVGGPSRSLIGRAHRLALGGVIVESPVTLLARNERGGFTDPYIAGNVGSGVLARFNLTFDYGHKTIVFEPNPRAPARDTYDRAGLWMNATADGTFEVIEVIAGAPAAKAGLQVGDRVLAIDGKATPDLRLPDVRLRLRTDAVGTEVRFRVRRADGERDVTIVLADLV